MTHQVTVRQAREQRKKPLTQVALAKRLGVDQTYISLIERGLRTPSDDLRKQLAKALGIAPSRLRFPAPGQGASVGRPSDRAGQSDESGQELLPGLAAFMSEAL